MKTISSKDITTITFSEDIEKEHWTKDILRSL